MTDEELREIQERSAQIHELHSHPGWPYFEDYLRLKLGFSQRRLNAGKIASLEEYREECGLIKGLSTAILASEEIDKLIENELDRRRADADQG